MRFAIAVLTLLLVGCATSPVEDGRDFTATWPAEDQPPATTPGAIYAQGTEMSLWQNVTARNVGDTLTIRLQENTSAEKTASTSANKSSQADLTGPVIADIFLGKIKKWNDPAIVTLNRGVSLPSTDITVAHTRAKRLANLVMTTSRLSSIRLTGVVGP